MNSESEFYVGYLPIPRSIENAVRRIVFSLAALAVLTALLLVIGQHPFPPSSFEFGRYREFRGVLLAQPVPSIEIPGQGLPWLLVGEGKHGVSHLRGLEGRSVKLTGERIAFGNDRAIEVMPGSVVPAGDAAAPAPTTRLGAIQLTGEVVDSKCYFGVMNPGSGKVHRDCAVRCISGGIPPAFLVRDAGGQSITVLLANWKPELLDHVAEPVTLRGELTRTAGRLTLRVE
jgi:hypothetical protein